MCWKTFNVNTNQKRENWMNKLVITCGRFPNLFAAKKILSILITIWRKILFRTHL